MALFTTEVEIITLAHCCGALFPITDQVTELGAIVGLETNSLTTTKVSIHKDCTASVLAQTIPPHFTPQSKYYAIKSFLFCKEIQKHGIKLLKVATVEQLRDILPKVCQGPPLSTYD